ncbi:hypothetical protein [Streptomyces sp. YIM 98790]|uniref:hypothetical protein n=1 Tax=Streptomyces sp. YIM 98790 TaxID=2689077 RepID=UPI00140C539E|nr:hypothetical protein [Streptomyces sp. YIM 98790]
MLYRCTSYVAVDGAEQGQLLDWDVLPNARDAYKHLRRAAAGVSQALPRSIDSGLRTWLQDRQAPRTLTRTLDAGGEYELELAGSGTRLVLSARRVLALPLLTRRSSRCPALILRGRHLWAEMHTAAEDAPDGYGWGAAAGQWRWLSGNCRSSSGLVRSNPVAPWTRVTTD